ncbi:hypothetical protein [Glaciihabitans sp. UYNi722]|uniref:hypothetical protein n=1 Tax=Glaciihabitans sp. UYNi722 TaxID=3156344 RepID=UPI003391BA6F
MPENRDRYHEYTSVGPEDEEAKEKYEEHVDPEALVSEKPPSENDDISFEQAQEEQENPEFSD